MKLLIIGHGYSSAAIVGEVRPYLDRLIVTARSPEKVARLCAEGLEALWFDGSHIPPELATALAEVTHLLISAPPDETGDPLLRACETASLPLVRLERVVYLSTVGVYGNHDGAWVDETTLLRPVSRRSRQRVAAESAWQGFSEERRIDLGVFRLSGIYGPGRSAIDNLRAGTARRIVKPGQVFNRIHVADIAGAVTRALLHEGQTGIFNLTDDEPAPPQDVVAHAARLLGIEPPPETPFDEAELSPMGRSFYGESKRVSNGKIKSKLGYRFRHPDYRAGLAACL